MQERDLVLGLVSGSVAPPDLPLVGGGDYCGAWDAGDGWILLVGHTDEAGRSLGRTARIIPHITPRTSLALPDPGTDGLLPDGRRFLLVRRVPGVPLSRALLHSMTPESHDAAVLAIGTFLAQMHAIPADVAVAAGIPIAWYPFAATEDGMRDGPAAPHYAADLDALARTSLIDPQVVDRLRALVDDHLARGESTPVLLHGEVSADHVFVDPDDRTVTGIIDFQGVVLGDPARDLLYVADSYGLPFVSQMLRRAPDDYPRDVMERLAFYGVWHQIVRLIWAAEHAYPERAASLATLVMSSLDAPPR